jgi:hypothetical protein
MAAVSPEQILMEEGVHAVSTDGWVMVAEALLVHPIASVIVTVYVPVDKFEIAQEAALLLQRKVHGPEGFADSRPLLAPKQLIFVWEMETVRLFTVTANVLTALAPQALFAVTVIFPDVVPAVAFMEFVVEVPVHPDGSVHV